MNTEILGGYAFIPTRCGYITVCPKKSKPEGSLTLGRALAQECTLWGRGCHDPMTCVACPFHKPMLVASGGPCTQRKVSSKGQGLPGNHGTRRASTVLSQEQLANRCVWVTGPVVSSRAGADGSGGPESGPAACSLCFWKAPALGTSKNILRCCRDHQTRSAG